MENNNDIIELLDLLYGMVNEAWSVPLGNDKCIIEREKAIDIINDIKANLPTSIAESKRLVSARDEFIGNAKREAESLRRSAEEQSARLVNEQEVLKIAQQKADEILSNAEKKSAELRRVAGEYVDQLMRNAEESLNAALENVKRTQGAFRQNSAPLEDKSQEETAEPEVLKDERQEAPRAKGNKLTQAVDRRKATPLDLDDESKWLSK